MMRFGLLVAGIAFLSVGLLARGEDRSAFQPPDGRSQSCDAATALDDLLTRSAAFYAARDPARGLALLHDALDLATASHCGRFRAETLRRLTLADAYAATYDAARDRLVEAVALFRAADQPLSEAQSLVQLGQVLMKLRRTTEAQAALLQARDQLKILGNVPGLLTAYDGLMYAMPAGSSKDDVRAEALGLMRTSAPGRPFECNLLHQWGDELFGAGAYSASFAKLTDAIGCFEEVGDRNKLGRALVSLGRVYRAHGRLEAALAQYERALIEQQRSNDREGVIQTLNALAVTLGFMGKIDAALVRYDEALVLARSLGSKPIIQFLLANVAEAFLGLGRNREAAEVLEEALRDPDAPFKVARLTQLSNAYLALGRRPMALETADRAVAATSGARPEELLEALPARARASIALGRFDAASEDMQRALAVVERLRANTLADDYLKRGFGQRYQSLFATTIALQQAKGSTREAIATAERARARAFLDLLAERTAAREAATSAPDAAPAASRPPLDQLPTAAPATFADMVGTAARLHSTVLAYWVGPQATFVWVVHPDGRLASARIEVTAARLASMVREASGGEGSAGAAAGVMIGGGAVTRPWRALYRLLVQPVRARLPTRPSARLTIVPHGPLFGLPFAALYDEQNRYLIESYDIHYVPALGVLSHTSRARATAAPSSLLVGDPGPATVSDGMTELPPIPWSGREVRTVGRMLATHTTVMVGNQATERDVRNALAGRTLLHFATHGIVRNEESLTSYLALQPSPGGGDEADGRLTAEEIYRLHLDADLIVLSGCRTALGPVSGEGVIGFTRAFLTAGASTVIAAMWDVPDRTSFEVMRTFYSGWIAGRGKSRSLRQAQLALIGALRAGRIQFEGTALPESPRLWAGFVLVGEP